MKKSIVLSLCALAAIACTKEFTPIDETACDVVVAPATINASISNPTKLGVDNSLNLFWEEGDQIRCRMSGLTWGTDQYDLFTAVKEGDGLKFVCEGFHFTGLQNAFLFSSMEGTYDGTGSSIFKYPWPSDQSGFLEDLRYYSVMWGNVDKTKNPIIEESDKTYTMSVNFTPMFCLLKFNVAEGLGVARIEVKGDSFLGGRLTIQSSRLGNPGPSFGTGGFAFYSSADNATLFDTISINRDGDEISGDVYVSLCPNSYNSEYGEYENLTKNLTVIFYDEDDEILGQLTKALTTPIRNAQIKNLGNVTGFNFKEPEAPEAGEFNPSITAVKSTADKNFMPKFIGYADSKYIDEGAKFYYEIGADMDAVATPTTASAEIPESGLPVDVASAYDIKYAKVLCTCPGHDDIYIKAVIRHWLFGKGYTLATGNGLDIPFAPGNADASYLSTPAFKSNSSTYLTAQALMGGNVSLYSKSHAGSNDKTFNLVVGDEIITSLACSGGTYSSSNPAFITTPLVEAEAGTDCKLEMKTPATASRNFYVWDYAIVEQQTFTPSLSPAAAASIDGLKSGAKYNF